MPTFLLIPLFLFIASQNSYSQCAMVCKGSVNVALDTAGTATIYPPMLLQSSAGCSNNFIISVVDTAGNNYGNIVNGLLIGEPLTATIANPASGNSCSTTITVHDNLPPVFECNDTIYVWCNQNMDSIAAPQVSDNVTDSLAIVFTDTLIDFDCFEMTPDSVVVTAMLLRVWTATDESGNAATCTQHIFMKRATLNMVQFPPHFDGPNALECSVANPLNLNVTGQPMIDSLILDNTFECELVVSYNDQNIPICGGSKKIIRTWTVFDLCTDDFTVFSQIIKIVDTTPPTVTCPAGVSFNSYSTSCSAQVWLPQATAVDACSGATVSASWQYGAGNGPFNSVPVGEYTATYTAKDGCNNTSTCQIIVKVIDDKTPTAICQTQAQIALEADGTAIIFANSFNNGSHDNCGIDHYEVSRAGQPFDTFISVECADLGQPISVTLKVVDLHGLESQCISSVLVKDQINPGIVCPPAANLNCGTPYNNPALTGQPFASDNCSVASVVFTDQVNINNCGIGQIVRTWKATDQSNNFITCQQTITITDNTPITIEFPEDILTYECEPNIEVSETGEPLIIGKDCEQLQITHTDYYFYTAQPACFQLIRKWAIINWCVYQPNDPTEAGFWEHTQVIEVRDSVPPTLTCPANMTVGITGTGCSGNAQIPLPMVDDCSDQITFSHNSAFGQSSTNASGIYPKGSHSITYTASDGCGNTSNCTMSINVVDAQAPNPVCNNGISVTIQQNGSVTVTPTLINNGSFDNCSPTSSLVMQVSPNTFTCQTLGSKTVMLTVTDLAGNSAFCQTTVVVQDNFNVCNNQSTVTIAGKLLNDGGLPLVQKVIGLSGGIAMAVTSDVDGTFAFPSLPVGQSYTLTPSYTLKPLNGVTTYDMVLIRRHILSIEYLNSPYKLIAADINKSGAVSTLDLVELQKMILNITTSFPNNNKSWRFVDAKYVFPEPTNPWAAPFPESITLESVELSQFDQDFVGIKIGDVNGSANPANFDGNENEERSFDNSLIFNTKDIELVAGYEYAIPFVAHLDAPIAGFQFTFDFDEKALEYQGLELGKLATLKESNFGRTHLEEGALTVSWENISDEQLAEGEAFFTLKFLAKKNSRLSNLLTINSLHTPAEAYSGLVNERGSGFELLGVALHFENTDLIDAKSLSNLTAAPNPFSGKTTLSFQLLEDATVTLRIYDVFGKLIKSISGHYSEGKHEVELDMSDISATGLLLCKMEVPGFKSKTIKLMKYN